MTDDEELACTAEEAEASSQRWHDLAAANQAFSPRYEAVVDLSVHWREIAKRLRKIRKCTERYNQGGPK